MTVRRILPKRWSQLQSIARKMQRATQEETGVLIPKAELADIIALADAVLSIAQGENASSVFEQRGEKKGNQPLEIINLNRAAAYWRKRIDNHSDIKGAVEAACAVFPDPPSDATIKRIASQYREQALEWIEGWIYEIDRHGKSTKSRKGPDTAALREYLHRKSEHFKD